MYPNQDNLCILALETSCDDTGAAVMINGKIHSNVVATQEMHARYGGVIPEMASRAHMVNIVPVVEEAMKIAGVTLNDLHAIVYARGPGLMGSLMVGSTYARSLALGLGIKSLGVDHLKAHVLAHFIDGKGPEFPFLNLLVSGGHTMIVKVESPNRMEIIGKTADDAAGEAFDKCAKLLGLPYPGGPWIDRHAQKGNPKAFAFPESRMPSYDYSFSGFKTAVRYFLQDHSEKDPGFISRNIDDICASVQDSIVNYLLKIFKEAAKHENIRAVAISGGVSANSSLRKAFEQLASELGLPAFIPKFEYCTDNAAMIAMAGHFALLDGQLDAPDAMPYARNDADF